MKQYLVGAGVLLMLMLTAELWMPILRLNVCQ